MLVVLGVQTLITPDLLRSGEMGGSAAYLLNLGDIQHFRSRASDVDPCNPPKIIACGIEVAGRR